MEHLSNSTELPDLIEAGPGDTLVSLALGFNSIHRPIGRPYQKLSLYEDTTRLRVQGYILRPGDMLVLRNEKVINVHGRSYYGETTLMLAAQSGDTQLLKHLISLGVSTSFCDSNGNNVLYHLCKNKGILAESFADNLLLLVENGVDVNASMSPFGMTMSGNFNTETIVRYVINWIMKYQRVVPFRLIAVLRSMNVCFSSEDMYVLQRLTCDEKFSFELCVKERYRPGGEFLPFKIVLDLIEGQLVGENEALYKALLSGFWSPPNHAALCLIDPSLHATVVTTLLCLPFYNLLSILICSFFTEQMRLERAKK